VNGPERESSDLEVLILTSTMMMILVMIEGVYLAYSDGNYGYYGE
jgi:hypothetical protein